jgi:O-antigen/teichoic acid export membrane protein
MHDIKECDVITGVDQTRIKTVPWLRHIATDRFRRLGVEFVWIALGQAVAVVGALLSVRLLTELLAPAVYGELALATTLATLINQTLLGPLGNGVIRFYAPAMEQGDLSGYFNAVRRLTLSATRFIVLLMLFVVAGLLIGRRPDWIAIAIGALILAILSGYNSILNGLQNAARQRSIMALHQGIEPWARFLVAAGLLLWLGATSTIAMIGHVMAVILVLGSQFRFFRKIIPCDTSDAEKERGWREKMWKYSWPFSIFGMFTWLQLASDRWALKLFATTNEVGYYAVLFQLGYYPMSMVAGMAMQFLAPIFYQRAGDATDGRRKADVNNLSWRITGFALGLTGVAFLVCLLFHASIFRIFVDEKYGTVSHLLPWMMLASGVFAAGQTIALDLMSQMKTHEMMMAKIITALLCVALNIVGAYWYGITGIIIAGIVFSVSYFVWIAVLSKQERVKECL